MNYTPILDRVRDPKSGCISTSLVAGLYKLPLRQLSQVLGQSYEALQSSPDLPAAQDDLSELVDAFNDLEGFIGDDEHVLQWLKREMPEDGVRPIDILLGSDGLWEFRALAGRMATGVYR